MAVPRRPVRFAASGHRSDRVDARPHRHDVAADHPGHAPGVAGQLAHLLLHHHPKCPARLGGPRGLDPRVDGEKLGLVRNSLHQGQHLLNLARRCRQLRHGPAEVLDQRLGGLGDRGCAFSLGLGVRLHAGRDGLEPRTESGEVNGGARNLPHLRRGSLGRIAGLRARDAPLNPVDMDGNDSK